MGAYRMSSAEDYLPQVDTIKVYLYDVEASGGSQYSIGDGILTTGTIWYDDIGDPLYTLLEGGVEFTAEEYPLLAEVYPSLITPTVAAPDGSSNSILIAGDYNE